MSERERERGRYNSGCNRELVFDRERGIEAVFEQRWVCENRNMREREREIEKERERGRECVYEFWLNIEVLSQSVSR